MAFDEAKFVFRSGIETLQLQQRESAAFLRRVGEGEDHGLIFVPRNGFGGGKFALIPRADEPVEIALLDRGSNLLVDSHHARGQREGT